MNPTGIHRERNPKTLNVIFHGLWAYVFGGTGIRALTPSIDEHVFKAGSYGTELRLKENKTYVLEGVHAAAQAPDIDQTSNVVLTGITRVDPSHMFCAIDLPFPDQMIPFRFLNNPVFSGQTANQLQATRVPDAQVLSYRFDKAENLTLGSNLSWQPYYQEDTRTVNLHIFAQPDCHVGIDHLQMASSMLVSMFPEADLQPVSADPADLPTDPGLRGVTRDDLKNLVERAINLPAGFYVRPIGSPAALAAGAGGTGGGMGTMSARRTGGSSGPEATVGPNPTGPPATIAYIELVDCLSMVVMLDSTA